MPTCFNYGSYKNKFHSSKQPLKFAMIAEHQSIHKNQIGLEVNIRSNYLQKILSEDPIVSSGS